MGNKRYGAHLINQWLSHDTYRRLVVHIVLFYISVISASYQTCSCANSGPGLHLDWTTGLCFHIRRRRCDTSRIYNGDTGYGGIYVWPQHTIIAYGGTCVFCDYDNQSILCNDRRVSVIFCCNIRNHLAVAKYKATNTKFQSIKTSLYGGFNRIDGNSVHRTVYNFTLWHNSNLWHYRQYYIPANILFYHNATCNYRNNMRIGRHTHAIGNCTHYI